MRTKYQLALLAAMLLQGLTTRAQEFTAIYEYDANGNRTSAIVVCLSATSGSSGSSEHIVIDEQTTLTVNILPNPTQGNLLVELQNATDEQLTATGNAIRVWDMQGKLLQTISPLVINNMVDLSSYINGVYILQLSFGGKVRTYKIIKN